MGKRKNVLFWGNGLNRLVWNHDFIEELIKEVNIIEMEKLYRDKKGKIPFTLWYELIFGEVMEKSKNNNGKEDGPVKDKIKEKIVKLCEKIEESWYNKKGSKEEDLFREFIEPFEHIITTNYDLSIERMLNDYKKIKVKNEGKVKETKFNTFRCTKIGSKTIWHPHGIRTVKRSISYGQRDYIGNISSLRACLISGHAPYYDTNKEIKDYKRLLNKEEWGKYKDGNDVRTWALLFFTHNIHIVGFSLDFAEMDIWYILTERMARKNILGINNEIYYYCNSCKENVTSLLESIGVKIVPCSAENYYNAYKNMLSEIRNNL